MSGWTRELPKEHGPWWVREVGAPHASHVVEFWHDPITGDMMIETDRGTETVQSRYAESGIAWEFARIPSPEEWSALVAERDGLQVHSETMAANWKSAEGEADRQRERATFAELERDRLRALLDAEGDAEQIAEDVREGSYVGPYEPTWQFGLTRADAAERIRSALAAARREGRRMGIEEAAEEFESSLDGSWWSEDDVRKRIYRIRAAAGEG